MSAATTPAALLPGIANPLALLRKLEWRVRNAVETTLGGEYRSTFRGRGMEFDQVVRYEYGDDIRDIDWNVTARLGEPYRKKFVEEREVTIIVVFEDTPSLQFGSTGTSKREALLELAGLVMLLGAVNRDRVGYVHATPSGYTLREPVRGRGPILHAAAELFGQPPPPLGGTTSVSSALENTAPAGSAEFPLGTTARSAAQTAKKNLGAPRDPNGTTAPSLTPQSAIRNPQSAIPWRLLSRAAPKHSIMVWLGDFAPRPPPDGWPVFQRRYQTLGFRVDDPWERAFPAGENFAAYDPVAGRLVTIENTPAERAAHARWRETRDTHWRTLFPDQQARLEVATDENRLDALVSFFRRRMSAR